MITTAERWKSFLTRRRELIKEELCEKIRVSGIRITGSKLSDTVEDHCVATLGTHRHGLC